MNSVAENSRADGSLIKRARRGSSEAFSELVRTHSRHIYCTSLRILKNHADAEDNLQDVLCKVYQNIRRFQGRSRFSTWLMRITINEALMKIRKENSVRAAGTAVRPEEDGEKSAVLEIRDARPSPERQCIANDLAEKVFDGLHPVYRKTIILQKGEGWTHRELAAEMGIAVATVKSRIFRTRARMLRRLQEIC